jgi:hypothetical protein
MPHAESSRLNCTSVSGYTPVMMRGVSIGMRKSPAPADARRIKLPGTGTRIALALNRASDVPAYKEFGEDGGSAEALAAGAEAVATSSMLAMGVTPPIASLLKIPILSDSAPASFPSKKTGLPLIPATTPVCSAFSPRSCTRITSCFGPMALWRMPRTTRSTFSTSSPAKIVYITPFMPGFT